MIWHSKMNTIIGMDENEKMRRQHSNRERFDQERRMYQEIREEETFQRESQPQRPGSKKKNTKQKPIQRTGIICAIAITAVLFVTIGISVLCSEPTSTKTENKTEPKAAAAAPKDVFEDSAFVGNSYVITLKTYQIPKNAAFFTKVGMNVSETLIYQNDAGQNLNEFIKEKTYHRIFLVFGENELGWNGASVFVEEYAKIIDDIRKVSPKTKLYIMSILPVSAEVDAKNEDQTNNTRIREFNEYLRLLAAEKKVTYVPPTAALFDNNLMLLDKASTDGVHLNNEYCKLWVEDLRSLLEGETK